MNNGTEDVPSDHLRPGRRDEGQHQGHDREGRVLDRRARSAPAAYEAACTGSRHPVSANGRARTGQRPRSGRAADERTIHDAFPLLDLKGVSKRFGAVQALTDVDFQVDAGEVVALVGDNGAGKSTLVKAISGVSLADAGEFRFLGEPVQHQRAPGRDRPRASRPCTRTSRCATTSTSSANLFLGQERYLPGPLRWLRMLDELRMEKRLGRAAPLAVGRASRA